MRHDLYLTAHRLRVSATQQSDTGQESTRLVGPQRCVNTVGSQQLAMASLFDDPPAVHHQDPVHRLDRGQAVGDHQRGAPGHRLGQGALDVHPTLAVQGTGRLVQDQDVRVLEDRPRDRDPLPLAADSLIPRSPTSVSKPSGSDSMNSSA